MKKQIVAGLMIISALASFGCGGRNTEFGVVDMKVVESKAEIVKSTREDVMAKGKALQEEMNTKLEGLSDEEKAKTIDDYRGQMNVINSEAQNKLKASLDAALREVAKEKNLGAVLVKEAVPQGGVDVTDAVVEKMK